MPRGARYLHELHFIPTFALQRAQLKISSASSTKQKDFIFFLLPKKIRKLMESWNERWTRIDNLQFSSLFSPPPRDAEERNAQVTNYVEFFIQSISEQFLDDLAQLIRRRYPSEECTLFDDVLAFVLRHPEQARAVVPPIVSCINDSFLEYDKSSPPFASFISLKRKCSEQLVLAFGEILRVLTHYNRPVYKRGRRLANAVSKSADKVSSSNSPEMEKKLLRPLTPWITDILLEAPLDVRLDYFRWCGGVSIAAELEPPSTDNLAFLASSHGSVLVTSAPTWAVANGAAVILSVCDEEVSRYETWTLTAAAVPAVLLPPSTAPKDEHPVAGLPALEPYARLFHRYYASASPSVAQKLLLRLLEAPPSWGHYALKAAVQLIELLRAADEGASGMKLPRNWMYSYFLRAIGIAMSKQDGAAADATAALLFCLLSQPDLLFPVTELRSDYLGSLAESDQLREATAQEVASMLRAHGLEVECRICKIWEAAYGLIPRASSSSMDLPEIEASTSLQPPVLSWNLSIPLLIVLKYLPRGSPSEQCLMKISVATIKAVLERARNASESKNLLAEVRTMLHSLFLETSASVELASRLLFVAFTVFFSEGVVEGEVERGPISAFDSYVIASVCALAFELHTYSIISKKSGRAKCRAIAHTRRMLAILESLVSSRISCIETLFSCSSDEIMATAMVAAHVSDTLRRSKASMQSLLLLKRSKWDKEVRSRANSLFNRINSHCKTVASMAEKAKAMEDLRLHGKKCRNSFHLKSGEESSLQCEKLTGSEGLDMHEKAGSSEVEKHTKRAPILYLVEKQDMCFLVVSLLWHVLIVSSEIEAKGESSSSRQGWRKVLDSLSKLVSASPAKAATAIVLQAGSELKPWIFKDGDHGRKTRRINRRIVRAIAELMNHENSQCLMIMATSSDLLLRASDGILVDEEASTLPQLELLEAAAKAVAPLLEENDESGFAVVECMSNLLKLRLLATAGCVSHPSIRVRALATSVLRAVVRLNTIRSSSSYNLSELRDGVVKWLRWEAHSRLAMGLPIHLVEEAAKELGFTIST